MVASSAVAQAVLLVLALLVGNRVARVTVRVMWVVDVVHVLDLPVFRPVHVLLVVVVDHQIAVLVNKVVIVVVHVLLLVRTDHLLAQVALVLAVQV